MVPPAELVKITVRLTPEQADRLRQLTACHTIEYALQNLAMLAAQGVQRPGTWEYEWTRQAFPSLPRIVRPPVEADEIPW